MSTHKIFIGLGTNAEYGSLMLQSARRKLGIAFRGEQRFSEPVQTQPVDFPGGRLFLNQVAVIETTVPPTLMRSLLKGIERELGRKPEDVQEGIVKIDLDLLSVDGQIFKAEDWQRDYVQAALAELGA
ncbi:MAG: 2-amino-4-hydroxy-6-hydroxymethyldihydropteridine diphosphokinase [Bacteroidaceae bacterium]|nr:2-amino-4-hydroxy-6-hydroxymethyldihydropteridine diphosphokinase [Bacteroidaceae bacterium]MBR1800169.1 2-amino-4-hydroxy-6-hydroxymethyldihydropteridine diphosphokinase [Bacteroidaceae bacterium]